MLQIIQSIQYINFVTNKVGIGGEHRQGPNGEVTRDWMSKRRQLVRDG